MSNPISLPLATSQPDQETYGVDVLALFQTYTRESYRAAFGVEAPWWDPTRLRKSWFDSSVDTSNPRRMVSYKQLVPDASGAWVVQEIQFTATDAGNVNFPGVMVYAPYVIAPTGAMRGSSSVSPLYLSLEADARALMAEVGGTTLVDDGITPVFPAIYPPDEPRRMWSIVYASINIQKSNVGIMLSARNARGVGSPGHWDLSSGNPVWVPDPPLPDGFDDVRPESPMPVRALLPNEALRPVATALGPLGVCIVRTDLEQQAAQQSGAFLPADRQLLQNIYQIVSAQK